MDLIDEDSLLTEEDLKKPQLPVGKILGSKNLYFGEPSVLNLLDSFVHHSLNRDAFAVGDCEVGSTRKACKNCTCGRAEEEEKVEKLGLTMDQLNNPQSACGNVCPIIPCLCCR